VKINRQSPRQGRPVKAKKRKYLRNLQSRPLKLRKAPTRNKKSQKRKNPREKRRRNIRNAGNMVDPNTNTSVQNTKSVRTKTNHQRNLKLWMRTTQGKPWRKSSEKKPCNLCRDITNHRMRNLSQLTTEKC